MELHRPAFSIIPTTILDDDRLPEAAHAYIGGLYALSNVFGYVWASDQQLATMYKRDKRTILRWNKLLEKCGYIRRERIMKAVHKDGKLGWRTTRKIFMQNVDVFKNPTENAFQKFCGRDKNVTSHGGDKNVTLGEVLSDSMDGWMGEQAREEPSASPTKPESPPPDHLDLAPKDPVQPATPRGEGTGEALGEGDSSGGRASALGCAQNAQKQASTTRSDVQQPPTSISYISSRGADSVDRGQLLASVLPKFPNWSKDDSEAFDYMWRCLHEKRDVVHSVVSWTVHGMTQYKLRKEKTQATTNRPGSENKRKRKVAKCIENTQVPLKPVVSLLDLEERLWRESNSAKSRV